MRSRCVLKKLTVGFLTAGFLLSMIGSPMTTYASNMEMTAMEDTEGDDSETTLEDTEGNASTEGIDYQEIPDVSVLEPEEYEELLTETLELEEDATEAENAEDIGEIEPEEEPKVPADGGFTDARWISVNQSVSGSGSQYFTFTTDYDGYFTLNFQHPLVDYDYLYWTVYLYDANQQEIEYWNIYGYNQNMTTCRYGYPKGTYYISVVAKSTRAPIYSVCVNYTQSSHYETEANGSFTKADAIKLNTTYGGNLDGNYDKDYYKFTLTKPGRIEVAFGHDIVDDGGWNIVLYSSNQETIYSMLSKENDKLLTSAKLGLPAGTYYIAISRDYTSKIPYSLKVSNTYTNVWEKELNDTKASADSITWGTKYYGTIMKGKDEDYYTFRLPGKKKTELVFNHPFNSGETKWKIALLDETGSSIWSSESNGYDTEVSSGSLNLPAGKYYVYIHSSSYYYIPSVYNFRIQTPTIKVSKIKLNKSWVGLDKGKTVNLKATVTPSNAENKAVTWVSSNTQVATVNSRGKVTAKGIGTTTITCRAKDGSGKQSSCTIIVYDNTQSFVARIYTKALGRNAEREGLYYWTEEIQYGYMTPVEVAESFFFAPEFTNKNLSNIEYVKVLYRTFMGREYDQGGLDYWVGRLNRGESRKSVLESFAGCQEFKSIVKGFGL